MYQVDFKKPCHIYFMGIGGISMSGLAVILHRAGFDVCGSDRGHSETTDLLEKEGITFIDGKVDLKKYGVTVTKRGNKNVFK